MGVDKTSSLVTPMEGYDVDSSKFPSVKIPSFSIQEDSRDYKYEATVPEVCLMAKLTRTCTQERK